MKAVVWRGDRTLAIETVEDAHTELMQAHLRQKVIGALKKEKRPVIE